MKKILFYYCTALALFISISGIVSSRSTSQLLMQLIFLPVTIYFCYSLIVQLTKKEKTSTDDAKIKRASVVFSILLLATFLTINIINIVNKSTKSIKTVSKNVPESKPKPTPVSFITLKKDYLKDKINVRDSASTSGKIIGRLENKPYQLVSKKNDWFEIIFENQTHAFVNEKFIEIKK